MEKEKIIQIERTIHFHELHIDFKADYKPKDAIKNEPFNGFSVLLQN